MKVIFLDVDGVLNNDTHARCAGGYSSFDPDSIDQLNRVLIETGAFIVISSTWRYFYNIDRFNGLFTLEGLVPGRVIDMTARDDDLCRGEQIDAWLRGAFDVEAWVAVDDMPSTLMRPLPESNVIKTDEMTGLRKEHADRMIAVLGVKHEDYVG